MPTLATTASLPWAHSGLMADSPLLRPQATPAGVVIGSNWVLPSGSANPPRAALYAA